MKNKSAFDFGFPGFTAKLTSAIRFIYIYIYIFNQHLQIYDILFLMIASYFIA